MSGPDLLRWSGRLHPVLVHFPIALVLLAALAALGPWRSAARARAAAELALALALPAALLAGASGWVLALDEEPADGLELHRWLGVTAAALILVTWLIARRAGRGLHAPLSRAALALAALATVGASHVGATLVWGASWLWPPPVRVTVDVEGEPAAPATAALTPEQGLAAGVRALLARRCVECHGPNKHKGELRLDDLAALLAAEPERGIVVPGEPDASEMLRLVSLPPDDLDRMPGEGDPLAPDEIALLAAWIAAGAPH